jgi:hypothetical protein
MADTKISALTAVSAGTGSLELAAVDSGTTKKVTDTQISEFAETRYQQGVSVEHTANQTITTSTWTTLNFNTDLFEVGDADIHDTSTNNERLIAQIDGEYLYNAQVNWAALGSDIAVQVRVMKNGTSVVIAQQAQKSVNDASMGTVQQVSGVINLLATDYLLMQVWHDRGSDYDVVEGRTFFGMFLVGR